MLLSRLESRSCGRFPGRTEFLRDRLIARLWPGDVRVEPWHELLVGDVTDVFDRVSLPAAQCDRLRFGVGPRRCSPQSCSRWGHGGTTVLRAPSRGSLVQTAIACAARQPRGSQRTCRPNFVSVSLRCQRARNRSTMRQSVSDRAARRRLPGAAPSHDQSMRSRSTGKLSLVLTTYSGSMSAVMTSSSVPASASTVPHGSMIAE